MVCKNNYCIFYCFHYNKKDDGAWYEKNNFNRILSTILMVLSMLVGMFIVSGGFLYVLGLIGDLVSASNFCSQVSFDGCMMAGAFYFVLTLITSIYSYLIIVPSYAWMCLFFENPKEMLLKICAISAIFSPFFGIFITPLFGVIGTKVFGFTRQQCKLDSYSNYMSLECYNQGMFFGVVIIGCYFLLYGIGYLCVGANYCKKRMEEEQTKEELRQQAQENDLII